MNNISDILGYQNEVNNEYYNKIRELSSMLPKYCQEFSIFLKDKQPGTTLGYLRDVNIFLNFLVYEKRIRKNVSKISLLDLSQVTPKIITDYADWLGAYEIDGKIHHNSNSGKKRKIYSLKTFYRFLSTIDSSIKDPTITEGFSKNPEPASKILSHGEFSRLIRYLDDSYFYNQDRLFKTVNDQLNVSGKRVTLKPHIVSRDKAIILLLSSTGLRVSELVSLNLSDIYKNKIIIKRLNSGLKEISISDDISACLEKYINEARPELSPHDSDHDALFISTKHSRITPRAVQMMIKEYGIKVFGPDYTLTPHSLRASYGNRIFLNNDEPDALIIMDQKAYKSLKTYYNKFTQTTNNN